MSAKPRLDEKNVEVLAGDLPKGFWSFNGSELSQIEKKPVDLAQNIKEMKVRLKRKVNNLDLDVPMGHIIGMISGQLLGPVGSIATHMVNGVAGSSEFICVGCELKDGRKFIAWMHGEVYKRWEKLHAEANPPDTSAQEKSA